MIKARYLKMIKKRSFIILLSTVVLILIPLLTVGVISYDNTITPDGIIIHHSGVSLAPDGQVVDIKFLDDFHRRRGFGVFYWGRTYYIGYHYIIYPDGKVERGRPEHCVGAHASGHNSTIGVCLVGDFGTTSNPSGEQGNLEPTDAQLKALLNLCRDLRARHRIPLRRVMRHRDVNSGTECPGDRFSFEAFISRLDR